MKAYLACKDYGNTAIDVIDGSTITEEYSETLDSASIRLAPLNAPLSIAPYQEVKLTEGNQSWCFLVDDFTENQLNNREGGKVYSYSINLMSQTKYLEKIQLPNVCITHEQTRQTLWQAIQRFYRYCPKIKMRHSSLNKWFYNRFLTLDQTMSTKFDVPCADLQLSAPTLRQALTAVMSQIGCIPTVKNGVISYLDLRAIQSESGLEDVIVSRSQSSGSYVNSLVNASGGLLDSTGKSVSERLCFRDRNNLLLKQLQNLVLETRFPIYKVSKLVANAYFNGSGLYVLDDANHGDCYADFEEVLFRVGGDLVTGSPKMTIRANGAYPTSYGYVSRITGKASLIRIDKQTVSGYKWIADATYQIDAVIGQSDSYKEIPLPSSWEAQRADHFIVFAGIARFSSGRELKIVTTDSVANTPTETTVIDELIWSEVKLFHYWSETDDAYFSIAGGNTAPDEEIIEVSSIDMTKLCKEASARSGLKVDFLELTDPTRTPTPITIDKASEYVYTTVSYNIGDKFIRGFSDTYSVTNGWWNVQMPMVENLCKNISGWSSDYAYYGDDDAKEMLAHSLDPVLGSGIYSYESKDDLIRGRTQKPISIVYGFGSRVPINPYIGQGTGKSFATMFFDIEYQPISSPVLKFTRKGADFPIEQYDSKQNGLSSVEKVSLSEYETIDRLGSDVLSIHQRGGTIADLNSTYGDYTIFKRVISYRKNYLEADYFASKNYVLKNYFTAIQTKYRAYQYVDYSQSVERNECLHAFLELRDGVCVPKATDLFEIRQNGSPTNNEFDRNLIDGMFHGKGGEDYGRENITDEESTKLGLVKSYRRYYGETNYRYLDEASITHSDRFIAFTALDFDNASKGIYVDGTYLKGENLSSEKLGGIPQRYYPAQTSLQGVGFTSKLHYFDLQATLDDVQALPKYDVSHGMGKSLLFLNNISETPLTYKDNAERLGETFDFEIINYIPEFSFNENLISLSALGALGKTDGVLRIVSNLGEMGDAEKRYPITNAQYVDEFGNHISLADGSILMSTAIDDEGLNFPMIGCADNGEIWFSFGNFRNEIKSKLGSQTIVADATICLYNLAKHELMPICKFTQKSGGGRTRLVARINDTQGNGVYEYRNGLLVKSGEATIIDCSSSSGWERNATFDI